MPDERYGTMTGAGACRGGEPARVLLLVPTTSYRIGDFLDAAERLGVAVTVGSDQQHVLEAVSRGGTLAVDLADAERGAAQICAHAKTWPLAAIIGVDDETVMLAARASERLGLPHNPPEAIAATCNKHRFRTRLANSGLPAPRFTLVPVTADPRAAARTVPYPAVLKPLSLSASRGVIRADDEAAFVAAFRRVRAILEASGARGEAGEHILVEDYIPGAEIALEGLLQDGRLTTLAIFDKPDPLEGPVFEETIYVTPSRLPEEVQAEVHDTVERATAALDLVEGPIHAELRINERGVWPIEIAPRTIGGQCARALRFSAAGRLEALVIRRALGRPLPEIERGGPASGVMMIPVPARGTLGAVGGLEEARALDHIEAVNITIRPGEEVVPVPEASRYLGFIFARAETPETVEAALRAAHACLSFTIEPPRAAEAEDMQAATL